MHTLVLRSGTVVSVSDTAAKALIEQVAGALLRGSPVSVANGVLVRVDGSPEAAVALISQLPSVAHAESATEGIIVTPAQADVDPRPQIARALIQNNLNLQELRPLAVNLEEIFLELTRRRQADLPVEAAVTETTEDQS